VRPEQLARLCRPVRNAEASGPELGSGRATATGLADVLAPQVTGATGIRERYGLHSGGKGTRSGVTGQRYHPLPRPPWRFRFRLRCAGRAEAERGSARRPFRRSGSLRTERTRTAPERPHGCAEPFHRLAGTAARNGRAISGTVARVGPVWAGAV
jgi:hypothetical protein